MNEYDLKKFLESFVLPDLQKMIDNELHYYAFSVICQAIEVLGGIYDQKSIDEYGESETRFDNALTKLFRDRRYKEKQALFFSVLRGPFIHQLRPGEGLFICSAKKDRIEDSNHLERHTESNCIILVIERFYADFCQAFEKFKRELATRTDLDHKKVETPFIAVCNITPPYPTNVWSSEQQTLLTITPSVTGRAFIPASTNGQHDGSIGYPIPVK